MRSAVIPCMRSVMRDRRKTATATDCRGCCATGWRAAVGGDRRRAPGPPAMLGRRCEAHASAVVGRPRPYVVEIMSFFERRTPSFARRGMTMSTNTMHDLKAPRHGPHRRTSDTLPVHRQGQSESDQTDRSRDGQAVAPRHAACRQVKRSRRRRDTRSRASSTSPSTRSGPLFPGLGREA